MLVSSIPLVGKSNISYFYVAFEVNHLLLSGVLSRTSAVSLMIHYLKQFNDVMPSSDNPLISS